ncbi:membrane alanyl aminopeptidase-like [Drosophila innubila]|uniref:membrane alanyl aminopeptidase-like n=1 Tax=Drosophila innubila TaxID=198719 RepID=UPI00148B6511|nr:membrane alanyl aminopeptidase-like [Drosophila innubila]
MSSCGSKIWLLANLLLIAFIAASESVDYRLNLNVLPSLYNLTIGIRGDADNPGAIFDGEVKITLQTKHIDVYRITLHTDSIEIEDCWLYNATGDLVEHIVAARLIYEQETNKLTVPLAKAMTINQNYILHFKYTGKVRTDTAGLFAVSYVEEQTKKTKWVLLTEMQNINARRVFPCFDEPAIKAKFEVHIGRPSGFNAISNTKLIRTTNEGNNRFMDHFDMTPIMSTYLLAFVISGYRARGNTSEMAIYTRPEFYQYTEFSYSVAQRALPAFENIFQTSYKELGNELFQYATTPRFPHNSMENWGLVIFKDKVVLEEKGYTDGWSQKEFTIRNIVHENSHMWFGNSVTFKWWSYVWMQEGFARFYEFFMGHKLYPEHQLDQQLVIRKVQHVFSTDALNITQPMTSPENSIQSPADIDYKFGRVSFAKAACVIRMWRNAMGGDNFDKAIRSYLKKHHLGNVEPKDLFAQLKDHWPAKQNVNLDQFFSDFTEQPGYPMITVNISQENHLIGLRQKRFLSNPGDGSDPSLRYTIPITFATNLEPNFQNLTPHMYFDKVVDVALIYSKEPIDWIILNKQQSNYYRVFYDTPILRKIQEALSKDGHSSIAVENRAQLVNDLFNFASVGMIDYAEVFQFLEYLSKEVEYIPWFAAYDGLQDVVRRLTPQQLTHFEKYLRDITAAVYSKLGVFWSSEDNVLDVYNRDMQVAWLCKFKNSDCNRQVTFNFEGNLNKPSPDYRETFYCAAARSAGYDRLLDLYQMETNFNERDLLWKSVSCTRDYRRHYQNEILNSSTSVFQKTVGLAQMYQQNPDLITSIYLMITEDIELLADALGSWSKTADVLSNMADYFTTREQEKLFSDFIDKDSKLFGDSAVTLKTALSTVNKNVQWAEQRLGKLVNFLISRNGAAAVGLTMATTLLMMMSTVLSFLLKL